ncbi:MAG: glycosyltransferase family 4 protein [Thermoleophilum sp.]|nr:glycosyltransferase family 4 protein [Thermoleophilum sp.]
MARYLTHFLSALTSDQCYDDLRLRLLTFGEPDRVLPRGVEVVATRIPSRVLFGAATVLRRPRLDRVLGRPDVVWLPAVAPVALDPHARLVLTVHDLTFETEPRDFTRYERFWHRLAQPARLARRAAFVVVPSAHTARMVVERWRVPAQRVRLVRPGPGRSSGSPSRSSVSGTAPSLPAGLRSRGYVLAVGALEPRKRPTLLRDAYLLARRWGLAAHLVFAGDGPLRDALHGEGVVVLGRVDDTLLDVLYQHALCLACPSREEGFGFPPLEAATRGTPSVVSDISVFRETLGDAAMRFPSGDVEALAECLLALERDRDLRDRLAEQAQQAAGRLSWQRAANELAAVFRAAAKACSRGDSRGASCKE